MRSILFLTLFAMVGCSQPAEKPNPPANKWASTKMRGVLDAQDHQDTKKLCGFLKDGETSVREAAALAFASVQDSLGVPCLIGSLTDADPTVRSAVLFALGFMADSTTLASISNAYANEKDIPVQRAYHSAISCAVHRMPGSRSLDELITLLEKSTGQDRARVADAIRRVDPKVLNTISDRYVQLITTEKDADTKSFLLRGLAKLDSPDKEALLFTLLSTEQPVSVRVNAARVLGTSTNKNTLNSLAKRVVDPELTVRTAVLGSLGEKAELLDPNKLLDLDQAVEQLDATTRLNYYALLLQHPATKNMAQEVIRKMMLRDPYAEAARYTAMGAYEEPAIELTMQSVMLSNTHPAMSYAAYQVLASRVMARIEKGGPKLHTQEVEKAASFFYSIMQSKNAGLISAAAETLNGLEKPQDLALLFPQAVQDSSVSSLKPIEDLEARHLIAALAAKRDGLPVPARIAIPYNHPIDTVRLKQLKQGQRYVITTKKGTITCATDVNGAPGSCLVFDSLVTAGYYNGKAFHRMVPNFVVQGGCPRGDGYGGMPWTVRTEISRNLFTKGAIGLASAGRDTESCQFFITHSATSHLDGRYTRFGEVVSGMDVVMKLGVGDVMEVVRKVE